MRKRPITVFRYLVFCLIEIRGESSRPCVAVVGLNVSEHTTNLLISSIGAIQESANPVLAEIPARTVIGSEQLRLETELESRPHNPRD